MSLLSSGSGACVEQGQVVDPAAFLANDNTINGKTATTSDDDDDGDDDQTVRSTGSGQSVSNRKGGRACVCQCRVVCVLWDSLLGSSGGIGGSSHCQNQGRRAPCTMRVELIGHFKPCMTDNYLHI